MAITRRQREVYDFISRFVTENGYSPSFEEIGQGLKLNSLATVHKHISNLEKKGLLTRDYNRSRSIDLLPPKGRLKQSMSVNTGIVLPLMGRIAAGQPIEAVEKERRLLAPIRAIADLLLDTSHSNVHQFRELVRSRMLGSEPGQLSILFQAFNRDDLVALVHHGERQTGVDPATVHVHGAGATLAVIASFLCAEQLEMLAQGVEERGARVELEVDGLAIHAQRDGTGDHTGYGPCFGSF